ncbi:hypothetical protein NOF55_16705 [Rhizobiaceae bacterium BDR2-2]|uniref:Uncharacterized protein n=1 Tax=Ectorhizobium quercum TaxID=2965071 RepID=A0AAE3SXQ4_9HYPH|nr:hypothetical protein [Ectorhizobium quercum]MCX8996206.1 hypothetical protein [Ectorhizobium quercum]MCX8998755.1 hypothetical protein [Ectorhizobium quercum]
MLFNIQRDSGDLVEGYLIPDGFSDVPVVLVSDDEGRIAEVECDQLHSAVVASGRHKTGLVGFKLTDGNVPGLKSRSKLFLQDAKSGLLIYRRPLPSGQINRKVVRIETQLVPHVALDREMKHHFQYVLPSIERYGHETTLQVFLLDKLQSIYLSGRLQVRNHQDFFDKGFVGVALLTDPYYEMAIRLATLKLCSTTKPTFLGERDLMSLSPAIAYFSTIDLQNTDTIEKALKKAPARVRTVLMSPTTRQFACADAEQPATRRDIAAAMDIISRFEVIGHINDTLSFASSLGELLNIDMDRIPILQRNGAINRIAVELQTLAVAESYLEDDLILDYYVRKAIDDAAAKKS